VVERTIQHRELVRVWICDCDDDGVDYLRILDRLCASCFFFLVVVFLMMILRIMMRIVVVVVVVVVSWTIFGGEGTEFQVSTYELRSRIFGDHVLNVIFAVQ